MPLLESQGHYLTIACILVFCGTIGKSAQLPLHVWLPNSMEGPTPVSSLLHAATMVAAGVYMLARIFPLLVAAPIARDVIAWVGAITCLAAGLMATQQNDIKRILAYSTISQLGYMVLGAGVAPVPDVPMFHLFTHAFFKCLLFLCAGSVIVALHHEQDIWHMGGLKGKTPLTFACLVVGTLALSGFPGFSGYFSKDLIIAWAVVEKPILGWIAVLTAGLTAFYMFRLLAVVFLGTPRSDHAEHAHESPGGNGRSPDSPGHPRVGGRLRPGRKIFLPRRRARARSPQPALRPPGHVFYRGRPRAVSLSQARERSRSSYRFLRTGCILTIFTTGS